jgi:hypothetical protein
MPPSLRRFRARRIGTRRSSTCRRPSCGRRWRFDRFRLDPTFDASTLDSPAARVIARAMQEYGLILTDKSDALITQAEDPRPEMARNGGVNPYEEFLGGVEWHSILNEIPVDRLQALPMDFGRPCR